MDYFWLWLIIGTAFGIFELIFGTFVLLFFSIAAFLTAVLTFMISISLQWQFFIFALLALASLFAFKEKLVKVVCAKDKNQVNIDVNQTIVLSSDIAAYAEERVAYQGSDFTAYNASDRPLKKGERAMIIKTDGIKLHLKHMD